MAQNEFEAIKKLLYRVGSEIANEAKEIAPYDEGDLKRDIQIFDNTIDKGEISVGNSKLTPYARHVHEGTGIYGKKRRKITPKKKKALKTPFGVFKSIKGQKAQPYLTDGVDNYIKNGGFDRALDACGDEICEEVFDGLKDSLTNIKIK